MLRAQPDHIGSQSARIRRTSDVGIFTEKGSGHPPWIGVECAKKWWDRARLTDKPFG